MIESTGTYSRDPRILHRLQSRSCARILANAGAFGCFRLVDEARAAPTWAP
ncbi:unnamed protein product [Penicillium camemberti]|uniref:Str. FM013 n=1 Tax=Penicillium camemberti (strain FM 013) TaxID=1429867 RepID=A0A0G4PW46_PENC3|nr:unnamed protein product [Penicillium camemberti]